MVSLKCNMIDDCKCNVSYIDIKGFIYCDDHGKTRKLFTRARKLTGKELKLLKQGKPIREY